jgi:ankyrin repeat protein
MFCKLLIDTKADINQHSLIGKVPLFIAAQEGYEDICRLLIQNGPSIKKADNEGVTPLYTACEFGFENAVRVLIEEGFVDVNQCRNNDGTSQSC